MIDAATAHLQALGFQPTVTATKKGILVKVRTDKGWIYERFAVSDDTIAAIDIWASNFAPAE